MSLPHSHPSWSASQAATSRKNCSALKAARRNRLLYWVLSLFGLTWTALVGLLTVFGYVLFPNPCQSQSATAGL